ncbi:MAG: ASKHA domain-containing protein, partial [Candidatus Bathyarchaeia archaeon]
EFLIAPAEETAIGADIVLTQGDVREIQLAKAAVLTGAEILLREASLDASEIKRVFLAGAFGAHVRPESALAIGMLPPFKMAIIQSVGNAAGTGAKLALLSLRLREKAKEVAEKCQYIELHAHPSFKEVYFRALAFPA